MSDSSNENERHMFPIVAAFHHKVWQQVCAKLEYDVICCEFHVMLFNYRKHMTIKNI